MPIYDLHRISLSTDLTRIVLVMATDTVVVRRAELLFECCRHTIELWFNSVSGTTQLRSSCPGLTKAMDWWSLMRCIIIKRVSRVVHITEY